jgi:hypothetical protein
LFPGRAGDRVGEGDDQVGVEGEFAVRRPRWARRAPLDGPGCELPLLLLRRHALTHSPDHQRDHAKSARCPLTPPAYDSLPSVSRLAVFSIHNSVHSTPACHPPPRRCTGLRRRRGCWP